MKKLLLFTCLLVCSLQVLAQVQVSGYFRKDGTYVQPHVRSSPDGNPYNNYSYPGNYNPYTGVTAGGSQNVYLRSYYKAYTDYSASSYNYFVGCLNTNFVGLKPEHSGGNITDQWGAVIGYVEYLKHYKPNRIYYKIYNAHYMPIGYVETNKSAKKYKVYDLSGDFVRANY